jgi:hypothetical protein
VLNNAGQFHQVMINLGLSASEAIGSEMATITVARRCRSLFGLECEAGFASPVHSPEGSVRLSDTLPVDPIDNTLASLQFPSIGRS